MSTLFSFLFLLIFSTIFGSTSKHCNSAHFRNFVHPKHDDYIIYGITQDCQMFFIRPSQLHLMPDIRVDRKHSFCFTNLVQLHVKTHELLLLTFKQATNRICTLEIHIPSIDMLFGDHLFRYSLLNSLRYASCSHSRDQSFQLEPDLTFMDPLYRDVIYFVDALSVGDQWRILQFSVKDSGNLNMMNNLTVSNSYGNQDTPASEFLITIDAQKDKLYKRNKFDESVTYQCGLDMLFNQNSSDVQKFSTPSRGYGSQITGQAIEGDIMIYVETDRITNPASTRLNIVNVSNPDQVSCLSMTSFPFEVGIIRERTLNMIRDDPLPYFGETKPAKTKQKLRSNEQVTKKTNSLFTRSSQLPIEETTRSILQTTTLTVLTPTPTIPKPKGNYSPSKSFFKYESTTEKAEEAEAEDEEEEKEEENEISVENEIQEQDENIEFNEIIKELKSDEIGEMKTMEENLNMTSSSTSQNISNSEAVKGANHQHNLYQSCSILVICYFSVLYRGEEF